MKLINLLSFLVLLFIGNSVNAQSTKDFKKEVKQINSVVHLDQAQNDKLNKIIEKRVNDLVSIKSLRNSDEKLFRTKRRAIYKGSNVSIKMLITKDQSESFQKYNSILRIKRAKEATKLKKKNVSKDDILDAQLGIKNI